MSITPRTTRSEAIRTLAAYGLAACDRIEQLEAELADKDRQLAEARAEIERLKSEHEDSLRRAKDNAVSLSGTVTEYAGELLAKDKQLSEARAEIERLEKGMKTVQSAFKNYKNADAAIARITLREAQILSASCNPDAVNSERAANEILTAEIERKDKLIEQMREAISDVLRHAEPPQHDIRGCMRANCWWCQVIRVRDAALSAAERGE